MASSVVGNLIIRLAADTATYESGIRKAQRETERRTRKMQKQFQDMERNMRRAATGIATGLTAVTAGLVGMTVRQADAVKQAHALAQAVGTSTGELQAFQYAAGRVGVETGKAADIIKDLADKLGDASLTGGGELAGVLDKIGLPATNLQSLSPTAQLVAIGDAIKGLPQAQQVNVLESIADDGARLLPLLKDGAAGLRQYTEQARQFGIAMSDIDVRKMLEADRAIEDLKGQFQGLENEITLAVAPAITHAFDNMSDLRDITSDPDFALGIEAVASAMAETTEYLANAVRQIGRFKKDLDSLNFKGMAEFLAKRTGPGYLAEKMGVFGDNEPAKIEQMAPLDVVASPLPKPAPRITSGPQPANRPDSGRPDEVQRTIGLIREQAAAYARAEQQRKDAVQQVTSALATQDEAAVASFERRQQMIVENVQDEQQRAELISRNWQRLADDSEHATNAMSQFAKRAAENMQDSLADFLFDPFSDGLSGMLEGFTETLRRMAAEQAASQALKGIGKAATSYGASNGGIWGSVATLVGNSLSGARASGGPVMGGSRYLVGERGPEIFQPAATGTIVPNHAISRPSANATNLNVQIISQGGPMKEQKRERSRGADGSETIKIYVRNALNDMVGNGEMDEVFQPYDLGRSQTVT